MSNTKFTKGPWQFTPAGPADSKGYGVCAMWGEPGSAEYLGNAHLIAAAPEMYEMLYVITKYSKANGDYLLPVCIEELEMLLAKARGESCK